MSALLIVGALLVAPSAGAGAAGRPATSTAPTAFSITTSPGLIPAFSPSITDYAIRCTSSPSTTITTTGSTPVTVGTTIFPGNANVAIPLAAGQEVTVSSGGQTYYLRCLPSDFPSYSATIAGTPQQKNGYLLTIGYYTIVFSTQGVPVWWMRDATGTGPWNGTSMSPSQIGWWDNSQTFQVHWLNGKTVQVLGSASFPLDLHDLQVLPNGNYLAIYHSDRSCSPPTVITQCVDLSSWSTTNQTYPQVAQIQGNAIIEFTPAGKVVWSWDVAQHLNIARSNVSWHSSFPDVIHMNSIQYDGQGGIIFSARFFDAIYRIDMATGAITWKLGGTVMPVSLKVVGDSDTPLFSGQHDARLAPNGDLTVLDNGTEAARAPRALEFSINTQTMTATEVSSITNPQVTSSPFEGSAEHLASGDWVIDWGGNDLTTETNAQGTPILTITYPGENSYRVQDVEATVPALRNGMNAQVAPFTAAAETTVLQPKASATLSGTTDLDAQAAGSVAGMKVSYLLSSTTLSSTQIATAIPTQFGWVAPFNTTTVPNGTYQLESMATNAQGSTAWSTPVTITIKNPA